MERGETKENQTLTPRKFWIQTLNVKLGEFLEFVSSSVTIRFCTISLTEEMKVKLLPLQMQFQAKCLEMFRISFGHDLVLKCC